MKKWILGTIFIAVPILSIVYVVGFWGRPVSYEIELLEKEDTNRDGRLDAWRLDSTGDGQVDLVERDTDHDGRIDQIHRGDSEIRSIGAGADPKGLAALPKLTICLDGVPYSTMVKLWDQGYFREFSRPIRLISTFPSVSDVALTEALGTDKVPGYENLYYDRKANRIAGGATSTVSKAGMPYLGAFDYDEPGIFKGLAYLIPVKTFRADLGRFLKHYGKSGLKAYKAHICSTDSICHLMSPPEFERYLLEVDHLLRAIYLQGDGKLDILVFSDHGNSQLPHRRLDIDGFLADYGFKVESSLKDSRSVVIPAFGLVGAMPVYSHPDNTVRLARVFKHCKGVDFTVYLDGNEVHVVSARGAAVILSHDSGRRLKYQARSGDPLKLDEIQRSLSRQGQLDAQGFATRRAWFQATAQHEYPDAVNALFAGMSNHVVNRANLLVSFEDGYYYGSQFFDWLVTMKATHGNLRRASMTGFAMRNGPLPPAPMALRDLLATFGHHETGEEPAR